uniref:Uncharacterized protein n=1 Tax=Cucumis melo TaxID=3656 RepID=A0A9I9EGK5_CUCME
MEGIDLKEKEKEQCREKLGRGKKCGALLIYQNGRKNLYRNNYFTFSKQNQHLKQSKEDDRRCRMTRTRLVGRLFVMNFQHNETSGLGCIDTSGKGFLTHKRRQEKNVERGIPDAVSCIGIRSVERGTTDATLANACHGVGRGIPDAPDTMLVRCRKCLSRLISPDVISDAMKNVSISFSDVSFTFSDVFVRREYPPSLFVSWEALHPHVGQLLPIHQALALEYVTFELVQMQ